MLLVTIDGRRRRRSRSPKDILEQLRGVKEDAVTDLNFHDVNFYGPSERATIDVFRRVARLGRQIKLCMQGCSGSMGVIIKEAFAVDSVSDIQFLRDWGEEYEGPSIFSALSIGMRFRHLESVYFTDCIISREQAEYLGDGLVTAVASNSNFKGLHFQTVKFQDEEAMLALVSGLRQNSTLQNVRFESCGVIDAQVSQTAEALQSNSSLRELELPGTSKNRKLENLTLVSNGTLTSPIHSLVKSLKRHPCLKYLNLSHIGLSDADLGELVEAFSTCPRLETLNLSENKLTHDGLQLLVSQPLPRALRRLCLAGNDVDEEKMPRLMLRLLQDNPQLCSIVDWDVGAEHELGGEIQHVKDLNKSGRVLLGKDQSSVPLSLWPLVLERADGLFVAPNISHQPAEVRMKAFLEARRAAQKARRANAIFHLLQGPALLERRGGDVVHKASHLSIIGQKRVAVADLQEGPPKE